MPIQECASCLLPIERTAGIHSLSALCTKCSRLFHLDCLNSGSSVCSRVCFECESIRQETRPTRTVPLRQSTVVLSSSPISSAGTSLGAVRSAVADSQAPCAKRHPSSSPEGASQPTKFFCSTSLGSDMSTGETPVIPPETPLWAHGLFQQLAIIRTDIQTIGTQLTNICSRLDTAEGNIKYLHEKTTAMQVAHSERDTCEVRISNIPRGLLADAQSLDTAVRKVFAAMDCTRAVKHIYRSRIFGAVSSSPLGMAAVQFSCTAARDEVLSSGRKLKGKTANSIFGSGGEVGVYVNQILPASIHRLQTEARNQARALNYPPPITRTSGVFMRRLVDDPLIPITFAAELKNLPANDPSTSGRSSA